MSEKLTARQRQFIREYLLCRNGAEAARRAGYSAHTAHEKAAQLLAKVSIKAEIEKGEQKAQEDFEVNQATIIRELAKIAFGSLTDVIDEDGNIIDDGQGGILASISRSESSGSEGSSRSFSVSAQNKVKALELLGKHVGMWKTIDGNAADTRDPKAVLGRISELIKRRRERSGKAGADQT